MLCLQAEPVVLVRDAKTDFGARRRIGRLNAFLSIMKG